MDMFCFQCEQTRNGRGCTTKKGVCGKTSDVAALQDLLVHALKGLSLYMVAIRDEKKYIDDGDINDLTLLYLFATLTNVNNDPTSLCSYLKKTSEFIEHAKKILGKSLPGPGEWQPKDSVDDLVKQGVELAGIKMRQGELGEDVAGVQELITYGLKGLAAYMWHCRILGKKNEDIAQFIHEALAKIVTEKELGALLGIALKTGETNVAVLALLDKAHTERYGNPEPTNVRITPKKGKCILVSGHDMKDLELILQQTEGKGINVYTHGELLPANAYPEMKKFGHLAGNYGGAWQDQRKEFKAFPGPIVMTTNCLIENDSVTKDRMWTRCCVEWPGLKHIEGDDFSAVVEKALEMEGFTEDAEEKTLMNGFAHHAVLSVAGKVVDLVKAGKISKFFLIGGCDGAKKDRTYFRDAALAVPKDGIILTLACGKYRFNKLPFGDIEGIPRLLDCGGCQDAYSAVVIALELAKAFNCGLNDLPLEFVISWFEQKAVVILLTLLHLGVKNIRLGPSLPAFITPNVLNVLVEKWNIMPTKDAASDMEDMLHKE